MDLRELRYFLAVYDTGSVTAAARRCFISQPSVSGALSALEEEFGTRLFVRHRKGVVPTPAAEALYPRARRLVDDAAAMSGLFQAPPSTTVTLGLMRSLDMSRTLALLQPLTGQADLRLTLADAEAECDIRIVTRTLAREDEIFSPLWTEPYVVALPPQHPLRFEPSLALADLKDLRFVTRCHCENADLFAQIGFKPDIGAVATSEEWAVALVAAGVGVAVLPAGVVPEGAGVVIKPLAGLKVEREVGIAYRPGSAPPHVQEAIGLLQGARR